MELQHDFEYRSFEGKLNKIFKQHNNALKSGTVSLMQTRILDQFDKQLIVFTSFEFEMADVSLEQGTQDTSLSQNTQRSISHEVALNPVLSPNDDLIQPLTTIDETKQEQLKSKQNTEKIIQEQQKALTECHENLNKQRLSTENCEASLEALKQQFNEKTKLIVETQADQYKQETNLLLSQIQAAKAET